MTATDLRVLDAFPPPPGETWGGAVSRATGLDSGTVMNSLWRLERIEALVESRGEDREVAIRDGRSVPRRLYRLTDAGLRQRFENRQGVRGRRPAIEGA